MDVKGAQALADRLAEAAKQIVGPVPPKSAGPASDALRREDGGIHVSPQLDAAA